MHAPRPAPPRSWTRDERLAAPWDSEDRSLFAPVGRLRRFSWLTAWYRAAQDWWQAISRRRRASRTA